MTELATLAPRALTALLADRQAGRGEVGLARIEAGTAARRRIGEAPARWTT